MTVSSIVPVNNYAGNSSTKEFDFDFLIEDESELVVQHTNSDGEITTLTLGVDYSINEIGNDEGSYITFPLDTSSYDILAEDEQISLVLSLIIKQESEFKNSSYFNFTILEWTFDYIVRILQIMNRQLERCAKVQEGTEIDTDELVINLNTLADYINQIAAAAESISDINTAAENISDINTCAYNIADIQNASSNAQTAEAKAKEAAESADNSQIWAEGTDEEVQELGGTHSSKVWADLACDGQFQADWEQTDASEKDYIKNKPDNFVFYNSNGLIEQQYIPFSYNIFCINTGSTDTSGEPSFLIYTEETTETEVTDEDTEETTTQTSTLKTLTASGSFDITTAAGKTYTVENNITLDISDYEDGTYNIYINPVDLTISIKDNTLISGKVFPDDAVSGDYLLNISQIPYDLQQITIITSEDDDGEETTETSITTGLNEVFAGILIISDDVNIILNSYNYDVLKSSEIGEPILSLTGTLNDNEIWLEGAEVSIAAYPLLYEIYGDTYGTASDSDNFVLPDFRSRALWGYASFGYISAGLPNHRHGVPNLYSRSTYATTSASAAFYPYGVTAIAYYTDYASTYNSIYGQSSTVQPPAIKVRVKTRYKY